MPLYEWATVLASESFAGSQPEGLALHAYAGNLISSAQEVTVPRYWELCSLTFCSHFASSPGDLAGQLP